MKIPKLTEVFRRVIREAKFDWSKFPEKGSDAYYRPDPKVRGTIDVENMPQGVTSWGKDALQPVKGWQLHVDDAGEKELLLTIAQVVWTHEQNDMTVSPAVAKLKEKIKARYSTPGQVVTISDDVISDLKTMAADPLCNGLGKIGQLRHELHRR